MSVMGSLFTAISGLNSNGTAMEVIGNNLANINTPAFKASRAEFSDVLAASSGGFSVGRGSMIKNVSSLFSQGSFSNTQNVTDLALEGKGFFVIRTNEGRFYSRAGNFTMDKDGFMVNPSGHILQGFELDENGESAGTPVDIKLPTAPKPPKATGDGSTPDSGVYIAANLDSNEVVNPPFDLSDPSGTTNFVTSVTVYDSLGNDHLLKVYFRKSAENPTGNDWEYIVVTDANDAYSGVDTISARGDLSFNTDGKLVSETVTFGPDFDFKGGAEQNQAIGFDFGTSITEGGTGTDGTTQYGQSSSVLATSQDGYAPGYLTGIEIDSSGMIVGKYSNAETETLYQIAVANFRNINGMSREGGNLYGETTLSGQPLIGVANEGGNGRIFSSTLELSNVDLGEEFINMIMAQKGYQASSKTITTTQDVLQELMNMSR